jgi:hypothetical protein
MSASSEGKGTSLVCPVHGALDPGWTTCPYCEREKRDSTRAGADAPTRKGSAPPRPQALSGDETQRTVRAGGGRSDDATKTVRRAPEGGRAGRGRVQPTERMHRPPELLAWLIMKEGNRIGQVFPLDPQATDIGRDPSNHIVLDDTKISGFHAKIKVGEGKELMVYDLASENGTYVNGEKVGAPVAIAENDEVRLGATVLVLKTLE